MAPTGLDTEGYIEIHCAAEKITPVFRPALDESVTLLRLTFQSRLHSIYLYGSVATGHATLKQSDIDILVIFADYMSEADHAEVRHVARNLSSCYESLAREVGIAPASLQEALAKKSLPGLGCFIKHLCLCLDGEDIRPLLPKFRPTAEVARGFNGDYAAVIRTKIDELAKTNQDTIAHSVMRQICRKTLRTGFSLVMPRLNCWTTDLKSSFDYFCRYYPEKQAAMSLILSWAERPPKDPAEFLKTITPQAEWLTVEFDRIILK